MAEENQLEGLKTSIDVLTAQQARLLEQHDLVLRQLSAANMKPKKDIWEKIGAVAPILSGTILALGGTIFTISYNQQQLKLQEAQTIERFIPHLLGDEKSKRAAVLAISSLTDPKLAARVASIFASPGTVSALESIAENEPSADRKALKNTLARTLDNMAERYRMDKQYEDAIVTYKKALTLYEQQAGLNSPELVPSLNRIAELYSIHKDFTLAESSIRRAAEIEKATSGAESAQYAAQLRRLASLYKEQGLDSKSVSVLNQAIAIEQKAPATASSAAVVAAPEHLEVTSTPNSTLETNLEKAETELKPVSSPVDAKPSLENSKSPMQKPTVEPGSQESLKPVDQHDSDTPRSADLSEAHPSEASTERRR